jgi:hypothetical protein
LSYEGKTSPPAAPLLKRQGEVYQNFRSLYLSKERLGEVLFSADAREDAGLELSGEDLTACGTSP